MENCKVTEFKKVLDNDNLEYYGMGIAYIDTTGMAGNATVQFIGDKTGTKILGTGTFADGTTEIVNNANCVVAPNTVITILYPKYKCCPVPETRNTDSGVNFGIVTFNMDDLKYCGADAISKVAIRFSELKDGHKMEGNIKYLLAKLSKENLQYLITDIDTDFNISGNISSLAEYTALLNLRLPKTNVAGNISALSDLTSLTILELTDTLVTGDISVLTNMLSLVLLYLKNTQVSGSIEDLVDLTALTTIDLQNTQISGDRGMWFRTMCQNHKSTMKARTNTLYCWIYPGTSIVDTMLNTLNYVKYSFTGTSTVNILNASNVKIAEYDIDTDTTTMVNA